MWQKLKQLKENVFEYRSVMKAAMNKADAEKRDLTTEEAATFDELQKKADAATAQIDRIEAAYRNEIEIGERSGIGRNPVGNTIQTPNPDGTFGDANTDRRAASHDDGAETRALGKGETCVRFLQQRGMISEPSSVPFAAYLRAIATGPRNADEQRALSEGSLGAGGYTLNPALSGAFIDALRPASVVMRAGARMVPLTSDKNYVARIDTDPTPSWIAEMADVPESQPVFGRVEMIPKDLAVQVVVSRQLLADGVNIESALSTALLGSVATAIDAAALVGTGISSQPTGVANTSGINSVSMGTNGLALSSYSPFLDALYENRLDNGGEPTAAIVHPRTLRVVDGLADSTGQPLMRPKALEALPFLSTTALPINMTQGSASNASLAIVGDFSRVLVGVRLAPRIEVTPTPLLNNKLAVAFVVWTRIDIAVETPKSLAKIIGIIPA